MHKEAETRLRKLAEELGIPSDRTYLMTGTAAREIHTLAEAIEADVVVLGTHGQHGLQLDRKQRLARIEM